jgi:hypothetical protein
VLGSNRVSFQAQRRHMDAGQFSEGPLKNMVAATQKFWESPKGPRQAADLWGAWTTTVFDVINDQVIGRPTQKVMAGKAIRQSGLMNDGMLNTSAKAMEQAARGMQGTAEQVKFARDVFDMYGKYRAYPSWTRAAIQNYTPFAAWYVSSFNFMTKVLPRDHPVLLAVAASAAQVTDDVERQMDRPGWLKGTLDIGGTQWQATRNTPLGAFTDPFGTLAKQVLPQLSPLFSVGESEDWKGKKLVNPDGSKFTEGQKAEYIINEFLSSMVPAYAVVDRTSNYAKKPASLLNPVKVSTKGSDGAPGVKKPKRSVLDAQMEALERSQQQDADKILDAQMKALERQGVK